ncbi:MAG: NADH-quinone oxidoreductase subunit M [bacterium]|nr:NADH-quinone oxidoreductase subunit M [bacterium]
MLTLITFLPLVGAAVVLALPASEPRLVRLVATAATLPSLGLACRLVARFDPAGGFQFVDRVPWIPAFNIEYFVGVDGISVTMVLLTALLSTLCMVASWNVGEAVKGYAALFLLLETGMLGTFVALDFFLFFVFWELMLLPMYFLIGIWGGPRREYAAIKFFLYTLLGSVLILVAMLVLYVTPDPHSFDITRLGALVRDRLAPETQLLLWIALFVGFAIKIPVVPFHTWLPDAHVQAPTAISVILAGVLLKMGTYGLLRINFGILPEATWAPFAGATLSFWLLGALGALGIVYGAVCAMAQTDLKALVAYSSISHMGFVLLGLAALTPMALNGAVLQMFNHGTITAMLFLLVGVLYDRTQRRDIDGFGGIAAIMPRYAGVAGFAFFAAMGIPGLSAFISEVLVLLGAWPVYPGLTVVAAASVVLTAGYFLWALQRVYLGPPNPRWAGLRELDARELGMLLPLAAIVLTLGIVPTLVLDLQSPALLRLAEHVRAAAPADAAAAAPRDPARVAAGPLRAEREAP